LVLTKLMGRNFIYFIVISFRIASIFSNSLFKSEILFSKSLKRNRI
jgi:hypothetical protein